jgi:hypothetical protein
MVIKNCIAYFIFSSFEMTHVVSFRLLLMRSSVAGRSEISGLVSQMCGFEDDTLVLC